MSNIRCPKCGKDPETTFSGQCGCILNATAGPLNWDYPEPPQPQRESVFIPHSQPAEPQPRTDPRPDLIKEQAQLEILKEFEKEFANKLPRIVPPAARDGLIKIVDDLVGDVLKQLRQKIKI